MFERLVNKRIVVTGGAGFLGSSVVRKLREHGCSDLFVPRRRDFDLTTEAAVTRLYREARPDIVLHLAAVVGGIGANREQPGRFFYDNLIMGARLIEGAREADIEKFVCVGTICAYPKLTPVPFREDDLWSGFPEETNAPYGLAKKVLLTQLQAYREQYGLNGIYLLPVNLYGPGDNFNPATSHVIPAMIRRYLEARAAGVDCVTNWGSGDATREFLYVDDCAEGIVRATTLYDDPLPVNLGSGQEISIRELAQKIARLTGYSGRLEWDRTKPDGQPRRCLDTRRAEQAFGFSASTALDRGLRATIDWYSRSSVGEQRAVA